MSNGRKQQRAITDPGAPYYVDLTWDADQEALTQEEIVPRLAEITGTLREIRQQFDQQARQTRQRVGRFDNKRLSLDDYPRGWCLQIRDYVFQQAAKHPLFVDLREKGIVFKPVYILLKNLYSQNALQLGNYYVDVSNDTVDVNKEPLEFAPIKQVDYVNLEDYETYARVAERYLNVRLFPNKVFPLIAGIYPLLKINAEGAIGLLAHQSVIRRKDLTEGFPRVRRFFQEASLRQKNLPSAYLNLLEDRFAKNNFEAFKVAYSPTQPEEIIGEYLAPLGAVDAAESGTLNELERIANDCALKLQQWQLRPEPAVVAELQREGTIPIPRSSTDLSWTNQRNT